MIAAEAKSATRRFRFGVKARLITAFGAMLLMMIAVCSLAVLSFLDIGAGLSRITDKSLKAMATASHLSQQSESVVGQAPALAAVSGPTERETIGSQIQDQMDWLNALIDEVSEDNNNGANLTSIRAQSQELSELSVTLGQYVDKRLNLEDRSRHLLERLMALDIQVATITMDLGTTPEMTLALAEWRQSAGEAVVVLLGSLSTVGGHMPIHLKKKFKTYIATMETFPKEGPWAPIAALTADIKQIGLGEQGVFESLKALKGVLLAIRGTLARDRQVSSMLVAASSLLMDAVSETAEAEARQARSDLQERTVMLVVLSLVCLLLFGILVVHVQRVVLDPLARLRDAMLRPPGQAPPHVESVDADDELGDMARALEQYASAINQRERALRISDRRFRDMAENVPGMLFQWRVLVPAEGEVQKDGAQEDGGQKDGGGAFVYVGPRCQDLFGVSPEAVLEDWRALGIGPADQNVWLDRSRLAARDMGGWVQEGRRPASNGEVRWWQLMAAAAPGTEPGEVILNGMLTDITLQKTAEREIHAARTRAERALAELRATQDTLVQTEKLASLGQMVAGIAHEINTPLGTGITGASFLDQECREVTRKFRGNALRRSEMETFLAQAEETAGLIFTNLRRAAELVQGFKQVAVDQVTDDRRVFDLAQYVEEILISLNPRLRKTNLTVRRDIAPGLVLDTYPGALFRIVTNLVMNSLLHGFDEGAEGEIAVVARRLEEEWIEVTYTDTGHGIPKEVQPRVFDPFFTTRRGSGGTGLGMNIAYNLVTQSLGGRISLESGEELGVRFVITLPVRAPKTAGSSVPVTPLGQNTEFLSGEMS
ncbi:ATP-binding protein [Rhodospirillum sp. A1_3_36]|uniref:ATP-binding protein n=1 Tax=Rhodospirillum sp. A1_3_36 TaxID=3391666 RepID=UPI0039A4C632